MLLMDSRLLERTLWPYEVEVILVVLCLSLTPTHSMSPENETRKVCVPFYGNNYLNVLFSFSKIGTQAVPQRVLLLIRKMPCSFNLHFRRLLKELQHSVIYQYAFIHEF